MMKKSLLAVSLSVLMMTAGHLYAENTNSPIGTTPHSATNKQNIHLQNWLGLELGSVPMALARQFEHVLMHNQGVMVNAVAADSPAARAGISEYDIIIMFGDQKIFSSAQLQNLVLSAKPNETVTIQRIHRGQINTVEVTLATRQQQSGANHPSGHPGNWNNPWQDMNIEQNVSRYLHDFFNRFNLPDNWPDIERQFSFSHKNSWSDFDSIQVEKLDQDRYRAQVEFQHNGGDKKHFVFEGKRDDISRQIRENPELPDDKKASLLESLNMKPSLPLPDFSRTPPLPHAAHPQMYNPANPANVPPWARQYLPPPRN